MPPLARRYLKTSFWFGATGILTGMHMASALHLRAGSLHRYYLSAHTHMMLVGFFLMMFMAILLWKLPPAPEGSRYKPALMGWLWMALVICTIGRFLGELVLGYLRPEPDWLHYAIFAVSTAQGACVLAFVVNLLPRINAPDV
jgi:heme/copper-type cytochrome/quinol oxidase subunit 1